MRFPALGALAALVVSALVAQALGGVTVQLRSGNSVKGSLDTVDEVQTFTFVVPAGALLAIKAKGKRNGPAIDVRMTDDESTPVGGDELKLKRTGVVGKIPLLRGGAYTIEVLSRDQAATGDYVLKISWRSPRAYVEAPAPDADGGTVAFGADGGALVTAVVSAASGSEVVPRITRITGPADFEEVFGTNAKPSGDRVKRVSVPTTGDYTLHYANDGVAAGDVKAKVTVKQPRPTRAKFDVRSRSLDGSGDGDGGNAIGAVALPGEPTSLVVGAPADGNDPLSEIVGAGILISAGAIKKPVGLVIGTTSAVEPEGRADGAALDAAGPPVFFGPEGLRFKTPATITLPADVTAGQDNVVVFTRSGNHTAQLDSAIVVKDGSVEAQSSHFSTFHVFTVGGASSKTILAAQDGDLSDRFAESLALDGDTAVVGARHHAEDSVAVGAAYVFTRAVTGGWTQQAELAPDDGAADDDFGTAVAVDGDTVVVGANFHGLGGAAYVFTRDGRGAWTQQAKLESLDLAADDRFGNSVAVFGDTVVVGAAGDTDAGPTSGSAYVFTRDGGGTWTEQAKLAASDASGGAQFGTSVALHDETAVVGAFTDNTLLFGSGAVYVFIRDDEGVWSEQAILRPSDAVERASFGVSVAVHLDTLIVGAHLDTAAGFGSGAAYVYVRDGDGLWTLQRKLVAPDARSSHFFGVSVDLDGPRAVVGAHFDNAGGLASGAAYVFVRSDLGNWVQQRKLFAPDAAPLKMFGRGVAIDGTTALIGAPGDLGNSEELGFGYVFDLNR